MSIKTFAAAVALGTLCAVAPTTGTAGGEVQGYERPYTGYSQTTSYSGGSYAPPMPANYARPMSMYQGGNGCPPAGPCATMPYGYSQGRPGFGLGGDVFTAGLVGIGIGYLLFH